MRITRTAIALLSLSTLLLASLAFAGATMAGGRSFTTQLLGENEVPVLGDPDGIGSATVTLNPGTGEVCYEITVSGVDPLTAAHIHEAPTGSAGGVVIPLPLTDDCTTADRDVILDILRNPSDYYVNVHNVPFPGGALRGQLSR